MSRGRDQVDNMSLDAHHLLHRSCRGKAHASGIAKQNSQRGASAQKSPRSPMQDHHPSRQHERYVPSNGVGPRPDRKHSRNSTSSWECSDSDSMHSSEIGQNGCLENRTVGRDRGSNARSDGKERIRGSHGNNQCSPLSRAARNFRKECWADTLRSGCANDKIRRMEAGWDDSNIIRTPRERKWHRITAEIEQRTPNPDNGLRVYGLKSSWSGNSKKISKRGRPSHQRCAKPIQDIIEWEELFELALARKIRRKIRGKGKVDGTNMTKSAKNGGEGLAEDDEECMKRLEILLENRVTPQTDKVHFDSSDLNAQSRYSVQSHD